jgi:hypothetical protein
VLDAGVAETTDVVVGARLDEDGKDPLDEIAVEGAALASPASNRPLLGEIMIDASTARIDGSQHSRSVSLWVFDHRAPPHFDRTGRCSPYNFAAASPMVRFSMALM